MPVVTIDAKGELAEYIGQTAPEPAPEKPAEQAKEAAESSVDSKQDHAEDSEEIDFAKQLGITPEQHQQVTQIFKKELGRQRRYVREAEQFAAAQYSERQLAEQRVAAIERENAELKAKQPVPRETADPEAGKPKREDFQTDQAYWDAHIGWLAKKEAFKMVAEMRAEDAKAAAERQFAEAEAAAKQRVDRAIVVVPDFVEKVGTKDILIPGDMNDPETAAGYVRQSPMIAELLYYFSEHPAEAKKLADMPRSIQLVTIGKIEGTLKPFESKDAKPSSNGAKAPTNGVKPTETPHGDEPTETGIPPTRARGTAPVITPLNSASGVQVEKDPGSMSTREVISAWTKEHRANLNLRKRH